MIGLTSTLGPGTNVCLRKSAVSFSLSPSTLTVPLSPFFFPAPFFSSFQSTDNGVQFYDTYDRERERRGKGCSRLVWDLNLSFPLHTRHGTKGLMHFVCKKLVFFTHSLIFFSLSTPFNPSEFLV